MKKPLKLDTIQLAGLQGSIAALTQAIRTNTTALAAMQTSDPLIPALCHSLDRLQAEIAALRALPEPPKAKRTRK